MKHASSPTRPPWLKVRAPAAERVEKVAEVLRRYDLRTVCRDARCPNLGECWGEGTATVLILGETCTRGCAFCSVATGKPGPPDTYEPSRVASAAAELGWKHIVITSVTRDDLDDGGASQFVRVVKELRKRAPSSSVELLVPDFRGNWAALREVAAARPDVLAHNVETVPRLYPEVRPGAVYTRSLELLGQAHIYAPRITLKSGLMVGFGESREEVVSVMEDLFAAGCRSLTIGQYLPPSKHHLPAREYLTLEAFTALASAARRIGFPQVASGPLVRSSYKAGRFMVPAEGRP
ncbi:MAG: lipoyl synthase [Deltaproteobacteria bacterium]|nr:lipoyl synthase [Deltaproteobacteria bacterium]